MAEQGAAGWPPQWGTPPQFGLLKLPDNAHALPYSAWVLLLISTLLLPTSAASEPLLPPTVRRLSLPQKNCQQFESNVQDILLIRLVVSFYLDL